MDLNQTSDTYSLMTAIWKIRSELPRAFILRRQGQKTLFETDFELWPKISLQRNKIWTIVKKPVYRDSPTYPQIWMVNFDPETA